MKQLTFAVAMFVLAFPAHARCYSIWHYNFPQRCNTVRFVQQEPERLKHVGQGPEALPLEPPPPDIPLPSLENMEFPPDCAADWCERLRGIGMLRQGFETN